MATYTFNGKRSFAGESFGSLATLCFALFSVALFLAGLAQFVRMKPGFADHL